uniref:SMP-30/Gluconolactonase/LRE-like region domain-containing protein n=3 Tax=Zooxanthella nutricula TaxID=1333877 RepID=A0A7S2JPR4_9DINO
MFFESWQSSLYKPKGLAIDTVGGWLYWSDHSFKHLARLALSDAGTSDESLAQIVVPGLLSPSGIALDRSARHIYWTDEGSNTIGKARINEGNATRVWTSSTGRGSKPKAIALMSHNVTQQAKCFSTAWFWR